MIEEVDYLCEVLQRTESTISVNGVLSLQQEQPGNSYDDFLENHRFSSQGRDLGEFLLEHSVLETTVEAVNSKVDEQVYSEAFLYASQRCRELVNGRIRTGKLSTRELCLPGEDNYEWLELNNFLNWGRLIIPSGRSLMGLDRLPYNEIHRRGVYLFSEREHPSDVAKDLAGIVKDKVILSLGVGSAADEIHFLNNGGRVIGVEESQFMRAQLKRREEQRLADGASDFFEGEKSESNSLHLPENPAGIFQVLENMIDQGQKVDVVYAYSFIHFFDESNLIRLLIMVKQVLKTDGVLVFVTKDRGAILDGVGICLGSNKGEDLSSYLGPDGQIRYFRSADYLNEIFNLVGLNIVHKQEVVNVRDYDVLGEQKFHHSRLSFSQ